MTDHDCARPDQCSHPSAEVIMHATGENIRRDGFSVMGVLPDEDHYPFTYTTGLGVTLGHPELVVVGLDNHTAQHIIHGAVAYLREGGKLPPGERVVLDSLPLRLEPVDLENTWLELGVATRYYREKLDGRELEVMQVVVPDSDMKLPGEDGVDQAFVRAQDRVNLPAD